jgi:hypothetical protein
MVMVMVVVVVAGLSVLEARSKVMKKKKVPDEKMEALEGDGKRRVVAVGYCCWGWERWKMGHNWPVEEEEKRIRSGLKEGRR